MNIEEVNGIIIDMAGNAYSFGKRNMSGIIGLQDDNYHDTSFFSDIASSDWFQGLGFPYQKDKSFYSQIMDMVGYGFSFLINASTLSKSGQNYVYLLYTPQFLSDEVKDYLSSIYDSFKDVIEKNNALFNGECYDENGDYVWNDSLYSIDEFYDAMGISIEKRK